jgi:hypothetical protein
MSQKIGAFFHRAVIAVQQTRYRFQAEKRQAVMSHHVVRTDKHFQLGHLHDIRSRAVIHSVDDDENMVAEIVHLRRVRQCRHAVVYCQLVKPRKHPPSA